MLHDVALFPGSQKEHMWTTSTSKPTDMFRNMEAYQAGSTKTNMMNIIWRFPEIGVPLNHPFLDGIFHYKPTIWGYPNFRKPPYNVLQKLLCHVLGPPFPPFPQPFGVVIPLRQVRSAKEDATHAQLVQLQKPLGSSRPGFRDLCSLWARFEDTD